jgi:aspartate aminotransferase
VVADEIYEHINFSGTFVHCIYPRNAKKTVTVNVAKSICNDRMENGYIGGPEFIKCTKIQVTSGANSIAQRATITAVDDPSVVQHMVDAFHSRRDLVVN